MIKDSILKIKERISSACSKVNKDPRSITIVAVSKGRTPEQIKEVIAAGITDIGENKVQEALIKYNDMRYLPVRQAGAICDMRPKWHMVGHLQTNKAKDAVKIFDLIHSVDSLRLAEEIDKQAGKINKIQDILIQVNTSGEQTKFGLNPDDTIDVIKEIAKFKNINIKGLMMIAPIIDNPEKVRSYFRMLRELLGEVKKLQVTGYRLQVLSMGMTDDFEIAIEEGANMVRIGRAIFEG